MPNLWSLKLTSDTQTLPVLLREGVKGTNIDIGTGLGAPELYESNSVKAIPPINVIADYQWTKSPQTARENTPYVTITEKRLLMNSNVANLANSVFSTVGSVAGVFGDNVKSFVDKGIDGGADNLRSLATAINAPTTNQGNAEGQITEQATEQESGVLQALKSAASDILNNLADRYSSFQLNSQVLKPYDFLYSTEKTGFQYILPYFGNEYNSSTITFGAEGDSNILAGLAGIAGGFAAGGAGIAGVIKPGVYIEKAKQFTMGDKGRTFNVKFPLLNTGTYEDILSNWQLIFALIYQNRPGRVTRSIIDMPVIYEVESPGIIYMPFAYINSLSINFLGSRRLMDITVPVGEGGTNITTIIPDAYEVNITLEGMNEETRNFLYANIVPAPVTVGSPPIPAAANAATSARPGPESTAVNATGTPSNYNATRNNVVTNRVGQPYRTTISQTEAKAAAANDWLLPKDR